MSFSSLGLCDALQKAVTEQGYTKPSQIQKEAIPAVLSNKDVLAVAQTGTGKTASFTLPLLQRLSRAPNASANSVRSLIITPTRELAAQVAQRVQHYSSHMRIRSAVVFGGVRIEEQIAQLESGLDVLVATPGRLLDLHNRNAVNLDQIEVLVLDEADRMLELGFIDDIRHIQTLLPCTRQTVLFSATLSKAIHTLAKGMLNDPLIIQVTAANTTADNVKQHIYAVDKERKSELLIHLIKNKRWHRVLVFSRTKAGADSLVVQLEKVGLRAESIHANRTQHARTHALASFKNGEVTVLVATDIASRGIDIDQLPCVINFDLPYVPEDYVHRIGRTGRAGLHGLAVSLFSEDESKRLHAIEGFLGRKFKPEIIAGFAPSPKTTKSDNDNDDYGNFEAHARPRRREQINKLLGRENKPTKRKRRR